MFKTRNKIWILMAGLCTAAVSCKVPALNTTQPHVDAPAAYEASADTTNWANIPWKQFFSDPQLISLLDTALKNNQELLITLQEIEIAKNDVAFRKSNIYPKVGLKVGSGVEKVGRYTSQGAGDASTEITPGHEMPDPLTDFGLVATAHWEVDIWRKLHNAQDAAVSRYLATVEGKNFVLSNLIAEVANSYYELISYDNQLDIVNNTIKLQQHALEIMKAQKDAGRITELAVQKFRAELLKTQALAFDLSQNITEIENRVNFLLGRYPQKIERNKDLLLSTLPSVVQVGIPSQLLHNRPDVQSAEQELIASNLDVKVARAEFYPSLDISAALGLQAFKPSYLFRLPESMLYSLAGDLAGPLINKGAIKAEFNSANARQLQALYNYEKTALNAYLEVANQLANINNLSKSYDMKSQQVDVLNNSVSISNDLFVNAKADYFEVLTSQREALEAKLELVETKKNQLSALVNIYKGLGGGWK